MYNLIALRRVWVTENNESWALEPTVIIFFKERRTYSHIDVGGKFDVSECEGPFLDFLLMALSGVYLQIQDAVLITVV